MSDFWQRMQQRKLVQWAVAYVAAAFALLQGVDIIAQRFDWPDAITRALIIASLVGFVVTLLLAWYHGERGAQKVSGTELLLLALVLAVGGGFLWQFSGGAPSTPEATVAAAPSASTPAAAVPATSAKSIAVLPFINMSSDKEQDYFSDGLSEELLNQLAQIPQLRVIARTSSFSFKDKEVDVATIARTLGVAHVLEGSVRKSGDTLRITAQLIRASDSSHLWSQTYDRKLNDVFAVQDEISREVVAALKLKLLSAQKLPTGQRTSKVDAYEQLLVGLDVYRNSNLDTTQAIAAFQKAIALDPDYANAYAWLAWAQLQRAELADSPEDREVLIGDALASADRAVLLAPDLGLGYAVRGELRFTRRYEWSAAKADLETAYRLDPQDSQLIGAYSYYLLATGRVPEAIAISRRAVMIDPLNKSAWSNLGYNLFYAGQIEEARSALEHALTIEPIDNWSNYLIGYLDAEAGRFADAKARFNRIDGGFRLTGTALVEHRLGHASASKKALDELELRHTAGFAFQIASVYAWRGESDQAFKALDRAYEIGDSGMVRLRIDPTLASLRGDPRFAALVKKMGFPE